VGRGKGHIPLRTCISCGEKRNKKELIRLALDRHGQLARDDLGQKQGRGAYICKSVSCLENLSNQKKLKKVFRSENNITLSPDLKV
jgi:predicted RNA-binding protein YlxR (DUF448 family)